MSKRYNSRKNRNRNSRNRKNRNRKGNMYGGACNLGGAPVNDMSMTTGGAQSLAQGRQFADLTRSYHGGFMDETPSNTTPNTTPNVNVPENEKNQSGGYRMRGGMAPLSIFGTEGTDVNRASAHLVGPDDALDDAASYSRMNPDLPNNTAGQLMDAVNKGMSQVGGRKRRRSTRRRRATRGMRGGRRSTCGIMRGGRRRRSTRGMRGGRRSTCGMMRGGAIYEGAPYSQGGSDMLLADDPSLQAQAAKMESPAWTSVQAGTY